jgi:hypothetical protein
MNFDEQLQREKSGIELSAAQLTDKLISWFQALRWFTGRMDAKIIKNRHKGGWHDLPVTYLRDRLASELAEFDEEFAKDSPDPDALIDELADVANFAAMCADRIRNGGVYRKFKTTLGNHAAPCCDSEHPCEYHAATEF